MKNEKRTAFLMLSSFVSFCWAGTAELGNILTVSPYTYAGQDIVFFTTDGVRSGAPAGATFSSRWAFNATTARGKVQLAILLTAYSNGKKIMVTGDGTTSLYPDTETLNYFYVQ